MLDLYRTTKLPLTNLQYFPDFTLIILKLVPNSGTKSLAIKKAQCELAAPNQTVLMVRISHLSDPDR